MSETRKLAAILVSDVVGYSRLAGADEDRILARLRTLWSDLIDPIISVHHGRVVKRTGDGAIVEFRSVVDAVNCAIEVQRAMVERNAEVAPDKRIEFRIGIHLGDVVEESDGDLMGDGVNIAARLEGIAGPGAICLSEDAYRQVKGRLDLAVTDLGQTQLKNIAEPVRVFSLEVGQPALAKAAPTPTAVVGAKSAALPPKGRAFSRWYALTAALVVVVLAAGGFAWRAGLGPRLIGAYVAEDKLATAPRLSIVVLPFENLSGDPDQQYFADGITNDLRTDLSRISGAFVIARNTAVTFKGKSVDVKAIGRELGVRYVLEGSVHGVGDKVAVNAQLISTETGAQIWADRFDGERTRLGQLQIEFVSRLARSLDMELTRAEAERALRERPDNPDAEDLLMRGLAAINESWSRQSTDAAANYFERALAIDPNLVPAMIGLANVLADRWGVNTDADSKSDTARAEELIDRALARQQDNSWAHSVRADIYSNRRQWAQAIAEAEAAIAYDPNNADAQAKLGYWKVFLGRSEDGFGGIDTALRLSPRDPQVAGWQFQRCHLHNHLAQWDQAIEWCKKAVARDPEWWSLADLATAYANAGHDKEARQAAAQIQKVYPGFTVQTYAGIKWTDNEIFNQQFQRIVDGLRKAGVPEGDKKTD